MNRSINFFLIILFTAACFSCTTETASFKNVKEKGETAGIHFSSPDSEAEIFLFSDVIRKKETVRYISYREKLFIDNTDISSNVIGLSCIEENRVLTSDRDGNIKIYLKNNNIWEEEKKISLKAEKGLTFSAFSADESFMCLFSGITDSIYMYSNSETPELILQLYTDDTEFNREITDIDLEAGYIYLIDTENRISIIDYREKRFETEFFLESRSSLRALSIMKDKDEISLAALSPGSGKVFIYPLSKQYMMIKEKGYIKKAGITSFNYGTHVLVSENGEVLYALKSSIKDLSKFTRGEVTITGILIADYPVDGGPEFLKVSDVKK